MIISPLFLIILVNSDFDENILKSDDSVNKVLKSLPKSDLFILTQGTAVEIDLMVSSESA